MVAGFQWSTTATWSSPTHSLKAWQKRARGFFVDVCINMTLFLLWLYNGRYGYRHCVSLKGFKHKTSLNTYIMYGVVNYINNIAQI
jgi:hypothetical protein